MGTFKRLDDDDLDDDLDDLGPNMQEPVKAPTISSPKPSFKRLDDSEDELIPPDIPLEKVTVSTKSSNASVSPMQNDVFNDIASGIEEELKQKENSSEPKTTKKFPIGIILLVVFAIIAAVAIVYCLPMLKPYNGMLSYSSDIPVSVSIDGVPYTPVSVEGKSSVSISVSSKGKHNISFSSEGFETKSLDFEFSDDNRVFDVGKIELKKMIPKGTLFINCSQTDASFYIDGASVSPEVEKEVLSFKNISEGQHELLIKKQGFETIKENFTISSSCGIDLGLIEMKEADWRNIEINVSPSSADVYINGEKIDVERINGKIYTANLEPGEISIELRCEGFKPWKNDSFEVYSDLKNEIGPVVLQPEKSTKTPVKKNKDDDNDKNVDEEAVNSQSDK